jgi:hypothetical protein
MLPDVIMVATAAIPKINFIRFMFGSSSGWLNLGRKEPVLKGSTYGYDLEVVDPLINWPAVHCQRESTCYPWEVRRSGVNGLPEVEKFDLAVLWGGGARRSDPLSLTP